MALALDLGIFIASCLALIFSGGMLVRSLAKLAGFLKISEYVIAFILMAASTSIPELFVGISSALAGNPALALGNVIGSNIADLALVAGIVILLGRGIKVQHKRISKDAYWMVALAMLPIALMTVGQALSRLDGAILLGALAFYVIMLLRNDKYKTEFKEKTSRWGVLGYFLLFLISLPVLFFSSKYVVESGLALSFDLSLPAIFVGLFFLAIGTSLPELVFQSRAVLKGSKEMAMGDLIGSVIANSTLVLGVTAIIMPITANIFLFMTSSFFMILLCFMFAVFLERGDGLSWKEGLILLFMYILFLMVELNLQGFYAINGM